MSDKELFNAVLNSLVAQYGLKLDHPYDDAYLELTDRTGEVIVKMNPDGRNLLANLTTLTQQLSWELK